MNATVRDQAVFKLKIFQFASLPIIFYNDEMNILIFTPKTKRIVQFECYRNHVAYFVQEPKLFSKDPSVVSDYIESEVKNFSESHVKNVDVSESCNLDPFDLSPSYENDGLVVIDCERKKLTALSPGREIDTIELSYGVSHWSKESMENLKKLVSQNIFSHSLDYDSQLMAEISDRLEKKKIDKAQEIGSNTLQLSTQGTGWVSECVSDIAKIESSQIERALIVALERGGITFTPEQESHWLKRFTTLSFDRLPQTNLFDQLRIEKSIEKEKSLLNSHILHPSMNGLEGDRKMAIEKFKL